MIEPLPYSFSMLATARSMALVLFFGSSMASCANGLCSDDKTRAKGKQYPSSWARWTVLEHGPRGGEECLCVGALACRASALPAQVADERADDPARNLGVLVEQRVELGARNLEHARLRRAPRPTPSAARRRAAPSRRRPRRGSPPAACARPSSPRARRSRRRTRRRPGRPAARRPAPARGRRRPRSARAG